MSRYRALIGWGIWVGLLLTSCSLAPAAPQPTTQAAGQATHTPEATMQTPEPSPTATPPPTATPEPAITTVRVNQVGYLPRRAKHATAVDAATEPREWQLRDSAGAVITSGLTTVFGADATSGDHVHDVDFSAFDAVGEGYTISVGSATSHPFVIAPDIYSQLTVDALRYFYHNRSGIAIAMPFAGEERWARPAGHVGVAPNGGDTTVRCAPDTGCDYTLDVAGGWYDAGDHGKYVVNGGISVWTLLNQYERAVAFGPAESVPQDGQLNIPESGNNVPDLLDEARWEVEFLLKMQVPEGQPLAGMAHHKVHDADWTGLPLRPDEDPQTRYLRPPSTAATLNLAATAAQCARIWQGIDAAFAERCRTAAERAWRAAEAHPDMLAPDSDSTGGGAYGDGNLADERYWAAAELLITTGGDTYRDAVEGSPHNPATAPPATQPMSWQATELLGTLSLATAGDGALRDAARGQVIVAADTFSANIGRQGYRTPFDPGAGGSYPWGSNSAVLNALVVMGLAYDLTTDGRYLDGVADGMDYILGRNAMDKSYITGYGARPLRNPHHRFWAHQLDQRYPAPPPGAVSGGPNSGLQDPYAQSAGLQGCPPQKCFVDHIESWSTNEITINWNAPLAWAAAFLDAH